MAFTFNQSTPRSWRKIILMIIVVALIGATFIRIAQSMSRADKAKPVAVTKIQLKETEIMMVGSNLFERTLPLSGSLTPYTQATVSARAAGEVAKVLVREGQAVRQGEVIATLVDTTYRAQYDQAVANEKSAKSALALSKQDYENNKQLVKEEFISNIALQKLAVALESSRAQLQNAKQATVIAQRALSEVNIKAPISGIVSTRNIREGETAAVGTPIFNIVNIDSFELQAPISAGQVDQIQQGQTVQLTSTGLAESFSGTVERINPAASNGSRSYVIYIRVNNPTGQLKAGMFAEGQIVLTRREGLLSVPATALHTRNQTHYVYVVKDNKLAEQTVTLGAYASDALDALVEVTSGLSNGDTIVRQDLGLLTVGTEVMMLNADGTTPTVIEKETVEQKSWWQKLAHLFKL